MISVRSSWARVLFVFFIRSLGERGKRWPHLGSAILRDTPHTRTPLSGLLVELNTLCSNDRFLATYKSPPIRCLVYVACLLEEFGWWLHTVRCLCHIQNVTLIPFSLIYLKPNAHELTVPLKSRLLAALTMDCFKFAEDSLLTGVLQRLGFTWFRLRLGERTSFMVTSLSIVRGSNRTIVWRNKN